MNAGEWVELLDIYSELEPQARTVLLNVGKRLVAGQEQYGKLDVHTSGREYIGELIEELYDGIIYWEMDKLKNG